MGINHCCTHIAVAKKFLDCPYIVSVFQQVSRKRMTKGVATCVFIDATSKMACFTARCISDSLNAICLPRLSGYFSIYFFVEKPLPFKFLASAQVLRSQNQPLNLLREFFVNFLYEILIRKWVFGESLHGGLCRLFRDEQLFHFCQSLNLRF